MTFDKQMNLPAIADLSNYHLFSVSSSGAQTPIGVARVAYNLSTFAVTIYPTHSLSANKFYRVVLNGTVGNVLTDTSGNILAGNGVTAGTNYDVQYSQGSNIVYNDAQGNQVTIKISGGGTLGVVRGANGNATTVDIYNPVAHKTRVSGFVKKLSKYASGYTYIGTISGFGQFGSFYSDLTTPDFYVGSAVVTTSKASTVKASSKTVSIKSVSTNPIKQTTTLKHLTPKAPKVTHR